VAFGTIAIWFFYIQHQHEFTYKAFKDNWDYFRASIQGSSYYKLPRLFHWLSGNIGYHHIHHLNSLVPNYELARCHHENPVLTKWQTHLLSGKACAVFSTNSGTRTAKKWSAGGNISS